ncbi:MAG: hypothetical protein QXG00_06690, partial [Candidatus Woesearchaeota archaeon]
NGYYLEIISGVLAGSREKIIDYDGTSRIATLENNLASIPDTSSRFAILLFPYESFILSQNVFIDNELVFPPAQYTPINQIVFNLNYIMNINENVLKFDYNLYDLYKIYLIIYTYGYFDYLQDIEAIIVMVLQDFWKRKGRNGLQGIIQRTINMEDTLVEQNYLKEIFTSSYRVQLSKYMIPYEKRSWN